MKMGYNKHKEEDVVYMKKEKDKVYKVEIKPKWELNFAAKFYLLKLFQLHQIRSY